ncbi:MAG: WD40/YVTN/BNR-like repeat-containing protein [Gemmatimonadota bacterium]
MRLSRTVTCAAAILAPVVAPAQYHDAEMLERLRFRFIGPAVMSGRITDLAVYEADPAIMYVASATGGVWKTTNMAVTMTPVFERERVHSVGAVAVFQGDPNLVWVGTGEATNRQSSGWGDGVYKSEDGGRTWRNTGLAAGRHVARLVTHPTNRDVVYAAVPGNLWAPNPERGLYRTSDGGRSWQLVLAGNDDTGVTEVAMDPSNPDVLYAATYQRRRQAFGYVGGGPGSALWKTTDGGTTWRRLGNGLPAGPWGRVGISVYRRDPRVLYVSVEQGRRYTSSISYEQRLGGVYRSADGGASWRFMGDWNPRPSYSSKLLVDPSDESRLYQVQYSVSDDSGKTWREPRQSLHGDDRIVWVNPRDSRHVVKGDDGGLGISWDRGVTWLYQRNLPVSQFYHVGVDNSVPFRVCGGLQDNNAWCGPSETTWTDGILNEDWFRVGGGDGFHTLFDTTDNRTLYVTSQYLGLTRVDLRTMETRTIRPSWPEGDVYKRGNWGPPAPRVGRFQEGANWNAPLAVSAHDPRTLYAGMRHLYRSRDRGETWQRLGDFTTGVDRRTLPIMGQRPDSATLSLDDGISFFPTTSAFAESPRDRAVLWVGTDDGRLHVSRDEGRTWRDVSSQVPDVPRGTWVKHVEASRWAPGTAWVIWDGHQNGDFRNWMYRTTDYGQTWTEVVADLPREVVPHMLREDPVDPQLLYLGTEFGLFLSFNGGTSWVLARGNLPTVPVNDLVVHPRDHALVLGTHGRGIWILDDVRPLRNGRPGPKVLLAGGPTVVRQQRRVPRIGHTGDMHFRGENPPNGLPITLWAADSGLTATVAVVRAPGGDVWKQVVTTRRGLTTVVWPLRTAPLPAAGGGGDGEEAPRGTGPSAFVRPGPYTVLVEWDGQVRGQRMVQVLPDARQDAAPAAREAWHAALESITALARRTAAALESARAASGPGAPPAAVNRAATLAELQQRLTALFVQLEAQVGPPTADMRAQLASYTDLFARLERAP